jgi:hypothetical protein
MHAAQCYHRDIAPDNILITDSGPLLLDFGAARRVIGDMTHALTVVLKPGFAPIEQYGDLPGMTQGPWTDIYALASVLYAAITGKKPMPSVERLMDDRLRPLAEVAAGRFPAPFLQAIDLALALKPADRPQSVEAFRALLLRPDEAGVVVQALPLAQPAPAAVQPAKTVKLAKKPAAAPEPAGDGVAPQKSARTGLLLALGAAAVVAAGVGVYALTRGQKAEPASASPPALVAPTVSAPTLTPPAVTPSVVTAPLASPPVASAPAQRPAEPVQQAQPASVPLQEPAAEGPVAPPVAPLKEPAKPIPKAPVKEAPRQESAKPAAAAPAVTKGTDVRAKCSDILQKASLEPLSSSEQAFLRKECR